MKYFLIAVAIIIFLFVYGLYRYLGPEKVYSFFYWVWWDRKNPQKARPFGITCYVGLPGSGKTLSLVEELERLRIKFPEAKIYTNFGYKHEHGPILKWQDLVTIENGPEGVIFGLDEVHSIFDRKGWNKMPPEVLQLFSQNRKYAKQLICTAQAFEDVVVDIRRRTHLIIECRMVLNRWVFESAFFKNDYKEGVDGTYKPRRRAWRYNFIATNYIFELYDTYQIIKNIRSEMDFSQEKDITESVQEA